jgi:hypothetical protein
MRKAPAGGEGSMGDCERAVSCGVGGWAVHPSKSSGKGGGFIVEKWEAMEDFADLVCRFDAWLGKWSCRFGL